MPDHLFAMTSASRLQTFVAAGDGSDPLQTAHEESAGSPVATLAEPPHRLLRLHESIGASRRRTAGLRDDAAHLLHLARLARTSGDTETCRSHVAAARAIHRQAQKLDAFAALCAVRALRVDRPQAEPTTTPLM